MSATIEKPPRLFDVSPVISERLGVFPGDVRFKRKVAFDFGSGDHLRLSSIEATVHLGAHADSPGHYSASRAGIAGGISEVPLERYYGPSLVLHASAPRGARVEKKHLSARYRTAQNWPAQRILVRTLSFPNPDRWNSDFCSLDPALITEWAGAGAILVGIDTPSIDPEDSKALDAHQAVARFDLSILEGLVLTEVPEGLYTLIAFPLRIEGADASPVRAVLVDDLTSGKS